MKFTKEENGLLQRMRKGLLDGALDGELITSGGSSVWSEIKNGIPFRFKQGPGRKHYDGKENVYVEGVLHTVKTWLTDEEKIDFLRKYGWKMRDAAARAYSAKFKPKK